MNLENGFHFILLEWRASPRLKGQWSVTLPGGNSLDKRASVGNRSLQHMLPGQRCQDRCHYGCQTGPIKL